MDIKINKNEVVKMGNRIISESSDFSNEIKKFNNAIEKINIAWQGDDSLKYINVMRDKYIVGLKELADVIEEYGDYLKNVPEAYSILDETFSSKNISV